MFGASKVFGRVKHSDFVTADLAKYLLLLFDLMFIGSKYPKEYLIQFREKETLLKL